MATKYGPSNIDPAEWTWLGNFYQGSSDETHQAFKYEHEELERNLARVLLKGRWVETPPTLSSTVKLPDEFFVQDEGFDLWDAFKHVEFHANGGCASCGAKFKYGSVFQKLDVLLAVGHECASNLFGLTNLSQKAKRDAAKARKAAKIRAEWEAFVEADPELKEVFGMLFEGNPVDLPNDHDYLTGEKAGTVADIMRKGRRYGSISEKQANYVKLIGTWHREDIAKRQERREAQAEIPDVPEGRIDIVGTIVSTKWVENDFGGALKMLVVSDAGWKVWGTVPNKLWETIETMKSEFHFGDRAEYVDFKGSRVSFSAQVERSRDDRIFGFYKRPTKPVLIEAGTVKEGATE